MSDQISAAVPHQQPHHPDPRKARCPSVPGFHLNLKPTNVLLLPGDREHGVELGHGRNPRYFEFRLAGHRFAGTAEGDQDPPCYLAPEQIGGKAPVTPAADVYALGAILYECL